MHHSLNKLLSHFDPVCTLPLDLQVNLSPIGSVLRDQSLGLEYMPAKVSTGRQAYLSSLIRGGKSPDQQKSSVWTMASSPPG